MTRTAITSIIIASAITAAAQTATQQVTTADVTPIKLSTPQVQRTLEWPSTLGGGVTSPLIAPNITNYNPPEPLSLNYAAPRSLTDSLASMPSMRVSIMPTHVEGSYDFDRNPLWRDWQASGVITRMGEGYLGGSGSRQSYLGMGNVATGSLWVTQPVGERLTVTAGITGSKYHFDRSAWNDYGVWGSAKFSLNETLSINAFGQYYFNPQFHSMASMDAVNSARYGATLGIKVSDTFSVDVGAQRYYDPYCHKWRTLPIVAPTVKLWGQPISVDVGGIVYELLKGLVESSRRDSYYGGPAMHGMPVNERPGILQPSIPRGLR